jgi:hypothetical protein
LTELPRHRDPMARFVASFLNDDLELEGIGVIEQGDIDHRRFFRLRDA